MKIFSFLILFCSSLVFSHITQQGKPSDGPQIVTIDENSYHTITEMSALQWQSLVDDYTNKHDLSYMTAKEYKDFFEQFVNLKKLEFIYYPCAGNINLFFQDPPYLPHINSCAIYDRQMADYPLDWLNFYPGIEELSFYHFENIDLAPLKEMQNLIELQLGTYRTNAKVNHVSYLPTSLESFHLIGGSFDVEELNHLKLKKLSLCDKAIVKLPMQEALQNLEILDISRSSVSDLSPIEGNQTLKVFEYRWPSGKCFDINFDVIHSLSNLEELNLCGFPQSEEVLKKITSRLSKLQTLIIYDCNLITNLSFLRRKELKSLYIDGRLLHTIPKSVLSNPKLTKLAIREYELTSPHFLWSHVSPYLEILDLSKTNYCDLSSFAHLKLKELYCNEIHQIDHPLELLRFGPTLEKLVCDGELIYSIMSELGVEALKAFSNLKKLDIDLSECESIDSLDFLGYFPNLEELDVDVFGHMSPDKLDVFLEMKNLKRISIDGGSLDASARLKKLYREGVPFE